jgi:hypothetical protein
LRVALQPLRLHPLAFFIKPSTNQHGEFIDLRSPDLELFAGFRPTIFAADRTLKESP